MNIDFDSIKNDLIEKGLVVQEMAEAATQKVVFVEGEWNPDGSARIKKTSAGWIIGDFPKTMPAKFEVPQTSNFDEAPIKAGVQSQFPEAKIFVKIQ